MIVNSFPLRGPGFSSSGLNLNSRRFSDFRSAVPGAWRSSPATANGLGAIRACREGFKIGPLYAEDERTADVLFLQLAAYAEGANVYLDVPEPNKAARRLVKRYEMKPVFESARMYTGAAPSIPLARLYGVTTFELG